MLALALTTSAQVGAAVQPQAFARCEEACPDGDDSGHCPPACDCACLCHAPRQPAPVQAAPERPAACAVHVRPSDQRVPANPEPERIRHVPKSVA